MRILVKGGVWKNTEDEILKAAVMKYGKNQWARISSLLTRKTPKQCKARWFEWLDPSIKKTEWSKEEDEKLLHLAKLMPTQWRTIAPIVGRTPSQCLERYQRLLDEAEAKEDEDDDDKGPNADDVRRLRPGEIDPEPESKPARPDPIDMDEDEKEMLSEARARLANTQGKKAKRKAREKQLEEARRLAALQKRRELKAAGIETHQRKKRRGMDYNADIPFHKKAPIGFHDVSDEKVREKEQAKAGVGVLLQKLEGKRRQEMEEEEKKRDTKRLKTLKDKGDYVPPQAARQAQLADQTSARRKLNLPAPQVGDGEIEELMKIGSMAEAAKAIVDGEEGGASAALLNDYSAVNMVAGAAGPIRTPRTPAITDTLKMQARNLRAMEQAQTPLLGGSVQLEGQDALTYEPGATPRGVTMPTPNPLAAQLTPRAGMDGGATPRAVATPRSGSSGIFGGRTPLRDEIGVNTPRSFSGFDETPRGGDRSRQGVIREQLASIFKTLPAPKNEFDIVIPSVPEPGADDDADVARVTGHIVEDMNDVNARARAQLDREEQIRLLLRTAAVQRGLPRPLAMFPGTLTGDDDDKGSNSPEALISREMERLIIKDMIEEPQPGQMPPPRGFLATDDDLEVSLDDLKIAQSLIDEELGTVTRIPIDEFCRMHEEESARYRFVRPESAAAAASGVPGRVELVAKMTMEDLITLHSRDLDFIREVMKREHARAQKLEKRLGVVLGGYENRAKKLRHDLAVAFKELEDATLQIESLRVLRVEEDVAAAERVEALRREVTNLERLERDRQDRYRDLVIERDRLLELKKGSAGGMNGSAGR